MNTDTDIAWAAGFLDGEGCFTLTKQSGKTHESQRALHISASQVRLEPLVKLEELFGGKVKKHSRKTMKGTTIYVWLLGQNARKVEVFLPQVIPYMVVKKREAEILLDFASTIRRRGRPKHGVSHFTDAIDVEKRMRLIREMKSIRGAEDS